MWDIRVGMQVVYITTRWFTHKSGETVPYEGNIYTIRDYRNAREWETHLLARCGAPEPYIGLFLEEIINPIVEYTTGAEEACFLASGFRPCRTTDISDLQALLITQPSLIASIREDEQV